MTHTVQITAKGYRADELRDLEHFQRYLDVDGDGICYRSLPGDHPRGAYLIRGSGHNKAGAYTERSDEYIEVMDRLRRKFDTAANLVPEPIIQRTTNADIAIVSLGSCHGAVEETRDRLAADGFSSDYLRIRGFPFCDEVRTFIDSHSRVFVVEQNRDAQLRSLLMNETGIAADRLGFPCCTTVENLYHRWISLTSFWKKSNKEKPREFY
ncbi:MAG: hypothetical protein CM1200mP41_15140 [Gammaproteobacteria bacterium]|nr:MAG: hypothetical protein CM1200mP41_15140 [Gammaproteobacteria bacterium]